MPAIARIFHGPAGRRMAGAAAFLCATVRPSLALAAAGVDGSCPELGVAADAAADLQLKASLLLALCRDNTATAAALSFMAGLLTSLSPCVYPLIPITISIFGARAATTRTRAFTLSASYVAGMSVLYTALGVTFASLGLISGGLMAMPAVVLGIGALCLLMALSMFGAFEVAIPSSWQTRLSQVGGAGHKGAFLMGLVAGVIAAPCTGPVLAVILSLISKSGEPEKGATLMAFYSLGMGMLFLVLGTFSSALSRLPRSGRWMESVKSVLGILMVGAGVYLMKPHLAFMAALARELGALAQAPWVGVGLLVAGAAVGGIHLSFKDAGVQRKLRKGLGVAAALTGVITLLGWVDLAPVKGSTQASIAFLRDHDSALKAGREQGKPVMIDFGADWCAACKELEHVTYREPRVVREAERFVVALVDSTEMNDALTALWQRYGITGLPAVIFVDSRGNLLKDPRIEGFLAPPDFLREMQKVH